MSQVINTNIMSLMAQYNLNKSQSALSTSIQRLSTGYRINGAKDDAAGQNIANRFTSQIRGLNQAARNANDALSLLQTAEGGINQINDNLQRIRELSVQALNGTNTNKDIISIYKEIKERAIEVDRITEQVKFNNKKILKESDEQLYFQVGAMDEETIGINLKDMGVTELKIVPVRQERPSFVPNITRYGKDILSVFARTFGKRPADKDGTSLSSALGINSSSIVELGANEDGLLATIDLSIAKIDTYRGELGAKQNRFESMVTEINGRANNLTTSRSRIEDADYATEVSNMIRAQILQRAGTSVLAQANQVPKMVLSLLQ